MFNNKSNSIRINILVKKLTASCRVKFLAIKKDILTKYFTIQIGIHYVEE